MNELHLVLRGGTVVTHEGESVADIGIADGRIVAVGNIPGGKAREEINTDGLHIFPGLIDSHVHFNEPGRAEWEGLETGSRAFVAGGGAVFFDMPLNSSPPLLDVEAFNAKRRVSNRSIADFAFWGGLTPKNLDGVNLLKPGKTPPNRFLPHAFAIV